MERKAVDRSVFIHGTKYPNRVFVGGLGKQIDAKSLAEHFEKFGTVTEAKIIKNNKGYSRGYGFVTYATAKEAEEILNRPPIYFHGKKLNIGPAVRKQTPEIQGEDVVVVSNPKKTPVSSTTTSGAAPIHSCSTPQYSQYWSSGAYPVFNPSGYNNMSGYNQQFTSSYVVPHVYPGNSYPINYLY